MIPNIFISGNKNKGSSLMSPANGLGGSRATILFSFSKAAAVPALRALKQAGEAEGVRFELTIPVKVYWFSKPARSAALPPFQNKIKNSKRQITNKTQLKKTQTIFN